MSDIASLGRYAHAALGNLPAVCLVGYGVALGVYLLQGMVHGIVHFQLKDEDVVTCLYHNVGTAKDAFHLGVYLAVQQREDNIHEQLVERLALLPCHPLLPGYYVIGKTGYVGAQLRKGFWKISFQQRTSHGKDCCVTPKVIGVHKVIRHAAYHTLANLVVGEMEYV